jgi:membrane-bound lytic murein transglycosylase D
LVALAAAGVLLQGCAGGDRIDPAADANAAFPQPAGLEGNVEFWRNVYAVWSRRQVAIHDNRHMAVVYDVVQLPGPLEESYTPAQLAFVRAEKDKWSSRLRALERKLGERRQLSQADRELKAQLEAAGGRGALFGASERVRSQRGLRERFLTGLEVSGRYDAKFRDIFRRHGLPEDFAFLPHVESSFQLHARSSAGATGMWQFIRSTGQQYMTVNGAVDERLDPVVSADAAARYLKKSYRTLGSWPLAVTSYNHGLGGMMRAQARYGNDIARIVADYDGRYFGFASRNFYAEFLAARHVALNAEHYFPEGVRYQKPLSDQPVVLRYAMSADDLSREFRVPRAVLAKHNLAWLGPARDGVYTFPAGTTVWLPQNSVRLAAGEPKPSMFRGQ